MNELGAFQEQSRLSDEGLADLIEQRTGRSLGSEQLRRLKRRPRAAKWVREALDLDERLPDEDGLSGGPASPPEDGSPFRLGDDEPPRADLHRGAGGEGRDAAGEGAGVALEPLELPFDVKTTRDTLVLAYEMAGKGAAWAGKNPAYERVFDAHAEKCADAWIDLARRDAKVAKLLVTLTRGGAYGQLILIHVSLVGSLLITSGKVKMPGADAQGRVAAAPGLGDFNYDLDGNPIEEPTGDGGDQQQQAPAAAA